MIHITKEAVKEFEKQTTGKFGKYYGIIHYRRKPVTKWLLFRFRFALWPMKTFRLFRKPRIDADNFV